MTLEIFKFCCEQMSKYDQSDFGIVQQCGVLQCKVALKYLHSHYRDSNLERRKGKDFGKGEKGRSGEFGEQPELDEREETHAAMG